MISDPDQGLLFGVCGDAKVHLTFGLVDHAYNKRPINLVIDLGYFKITVGVPIAARWNFFVSLKTALKQNHITVDKKVRK